MTDFLPFYIPQLVKSLPFYIPEAWKRYPFRAEPPRIGYYRDPPPPGILPHSACFFSSLHVCISCRLHFSFDSSYKYVALYLTNKEALKSCITLWWNTTDIWEHEGNVESTGRRRVFSTFLGCSHMTGVFYHNVIHGLGFFICFMI